MTRKNCLLSHFLYEGCNNQTNKSNIRPKQNIGFLWNMISIVCRQTLQIIICNFIVLSVKYNRDQCHIWSHGALISDALFPNPAIKMRKSCNWNILYVSCHICKLFCFLVISLKLVSVVLMTKPQKLVADSWGNNQHFYNKKTVQRIVVCCIHWALHWHCTRINHLSLAESLLCFTDAVNWV